MIFWFAKYLAHFFSVQGFLFRNFRLIAGARSFLFPSKPLLLGEKCNQEAAIGS